MLRVKKSKSLLLHDVWKDYLSLQKDKMLDWSKLKTFAEKINVLKTLNLYFTG